jgi:YtcA family
MSTNRNSPSWRWAAAITPLVLSGCQRAPSFDVLGSFFPAWLFCFAAAILLTVAARFLLLRLHLEAALTPPLVIFPCLTALWTFILWLLFFHG